MMNSNNYFFFKIHQHFYSSKGENPSRNSFLQPTDSQFCVNFVAVEVWNNIYYLNTSVLYYHKLTVTALFVLDIQLCNLYIYKMNWLHMKLICLIRLRFLNKNYKNIVFIHVFASSPVFFFLGRYALSIHACIWLTTWATKHFHKCFSMQYRFFIF